MFNHGPGGSEKTYSYNNVYNLAIGQRAQIVCVAWTGAAANLLSGGQTVNLLFEFNIAGDNQYSSTKRQQKEASGLMAIDMIIWDVISMAPNAVLKQWIFYWTNYGQ
ncbi:hypothetical protein COOONC_23323 [Cooperia oncophora]